MSCTDVPLPDVFMSKPRKLEVQVLDAWTIVMFSKWISQHFLCCADAEYAAQPSKEERNSWKVAMDLDHVPWKALCKMYGLTLEEIAPLRMNAEGQPVERLDVWLLKAVTRSDVVVYHFDCTWRSISWDLGDERGNGSQYS